MTMGVHSYVRIPIARNHGYREGGESAALAPPTAGEGSSWCDLGGRTPGIAAASASVSEEGVGNSDLLLLLLVHSPDHHHHSLGNKMS